MNICYLVRKNLLEDLRNQPTASHNFVLLVTGALESDLPSLKAYLRESIRILKTDGILLVQGWPGILPTLGVFLEQYLTFKYWFVVESAMIETTGLPSVHGAVLLFTKGTGRFNIMRPRLPHQTCQACGRTLKDWGGKAHLMHPGGYAISDVLKDLPPANNSTQLSEPLFNLFMEMVNYQPAGGDSSGTLLAAAPPDNITGLVAPEEGLPWRLKKITESPGQYSFPFMAPKVPAAPVHLRTPDLTSTQQFNVIHQGDVLEILRQYPDESIDLAFADPPYNLDKDYNSYEDGQAEKQYIAWCNSWLAEYVRILKPTGSLFVLNLPRWGMHHADFLNQYLHWQNWIAWDALSEPRGKIMPAHYALLFYTKHQTQFTFNYADVSPIDARHYCLRASCIRQRKQAKEDEKQPLTDIWWDIHRIKHRRDRDYHPCQLPETLLERIIRLASNPGDVVLDAFGGAGSAPVTAVRLGRRYVAIDIDPKYVAIMRHKVQQLLESGKLQRPSIKQPERAVSKKALQLELRQLAIRLNRLPTPEEIAQDTPYSIETYMNTFSSWSKALKAAKLEL